MTGQKIKVLHFVESGGLYGAENVILNLSRIMADSARYVPIVGCIVSSGDEQSDLYDRALDVGLPAEKIVIRNLMLLVDLPRAARRVKEMGVDLIHAHGYKPAVFGFAIKLMSGAEILSTCHLWFAAGRMPLKMRAMVSLELALYRYFRVVVGVSEPIAAVLVEAGVPAGRTRVIKNGVEVGEGLVAGPETLQSLRQELGLSAEEYCVLTTGRLTGQKAHCDLVTAAAHLRDNGIICHFLIAGEGGLEANLRRQISAAGLDDLVVLLGFRDDVRALLQIADLFVLPSLDEGMPMSLLEAAALGVPVVVTPVGDIPKLIQDQVSGLVVPPGKPRLLADAIAVQRKNTEQGQLWSRAAKEKVERVYSNEAMYANYDIVYSELLG